jgi:hypothetical protein
MVGQKQVYVGHNFANKELEFTVRIRVSKENPSPSDNYMFPGLKQNPGCQQFKDREMEKIVTWWLITEDMDCYQQRIDRFVSELKNTSVKAQTVWKSSKKAVQ